MPFFVERDQKLKALIAGVEAFQKKKIDGKVLALVIRLILFTGIKKNEISSITVGDFCTANFKLRASITVGGHELLLDKKSRQKFQDHIDGLLQTDPGLGMNDLLFKRYGCVKTLGRDLAALKTGFGFNSIRDFGVRRCYFGILKAEKSKGSPSSHPVSSPRSCPIKAFERHCEKVAKENTAKRYGLTPKDAYRKAYGKMPGPGRKREEGYGQESMDFGTRLKEYMDLLEHISPDRGLNEVQDLVDEVINLVEDAEMSHHPEADLESTLEVLGNLMEEKGLAFDRETYEVNILPDRKP